MHKRRLRQKVTSPPHLEKLLQTYFWALLVAGRCCWPIQVISNVFLRQFWFYFWQPGGRAGAVDQSKSRPRASFWSISSDSTILQLASVKCTKPHCIVSTVFKWWHCSDVPIYFFKHPIVMSMHPPWNWRATANLTFWHLREHIEDKRLNILYLMKIQTC